MFVNIGVPSVGHPIPLSGSQFGEEYGRNPTRFIAVPPAAPVTVQAVVTRLMGHGTFGPPGVAPAMYGRCNTLPAGSVKEYWASSENGPQVKLGFSAGSFSPICAISRQVCAFEAF